MVYFSEMQRFRQPWFRLSLLSLAIAPAVYWYGIYQQVERGQPFGNRPTGDQALLNTAIITSLFSLVVLWLLWNMELRTEVRDGGLFVRFFPFLRREIPYHDIRTAEARTCQPLREYGGWGIRIGRSGTAYSVSGDRGVQLVLASGKRLFIGSQRADELALALAPRIGS